MVLDDSAFKNGWHGYSLLVFSKIFRHKQGSNEKKTEKKHIFQYLVDERFRACPTMPDPRVRTQIKVLLKF